MWLSIALMILGIGAYPTHSAPDQCPRAMVICKDHSPGETAVTCFASVYGSSQHPPKLNWRASRGKIVGSHKSDTVTIDVRNVKTDSVTATLKVRWKNLEVCNASESTTVELRR